METEIHTGTFLDYKSCWVRNSIAAATKVDLQDALNRGKKDGWLCYGGLGAIWLDYILDYNDLWTLSYGEQIIALQLAIESFDSFID